MKKVLIVLTGFFALLPLGSLSFAGELLGQVTEQKTNLPIPGARVILWRGRRVIGSSPRTDSQGKFSIVNISDSNYDVEVFYPAYIKKRIKSVELKPVSPQELLRVQLALEPIKTTFVEIDREKQFYPNSRIMGKVLWKRTNEPLWGVRVRLLLSDGTSAKMGAMTDTTGNFHLLNVPPGTYQIDINYGPTVDGQRLKKVKVEAGRIYTIGTIFLKERFSEGDTLEVVY